MPIEYSREMLDAAELTILAYETAIYKLERGSSQLFLKQWNDFGTVEACRMCKVARVTGYINADCSSCILTISNRSMDCARSSTYDNLIETIRFYKFNMRYVDEATEEEFISLLKDRLAFLLARMDKNGYTFIHRTAYRKREKK